MKWRRWLGALSGGLLLSAPPAGAHIRDDLSRLRAELPTLSLEGQYVSPAWEAYLRYYDLPLRAARQAGYLTLSNQERIFVQYFRPASAPRATLVMTHGYFTHAGIQHHAITAFVQAGYAVLSVDLPGHGLSSGKQADIDDFSDYARAFAQVSTFAAAQLSPPLIAVGHSTGAAGIWEYLLRTPDQPYCAAVLAAPLVRSWLWELSWVGFQLGQNLLSELPRLVRSTTSAPEFVPFVERDPLQYFATPLNWVRSLIRWNEQVIEALPPSQLPLLIVQGDRDQVVEWTYNLPFLARKFPRAQIEMITGASHDLFWEAPALRTETFARMARFLDSQLESPGCVGGP